MFAVFPLGRRQNGKLLGAKAEQAIAFMVPAFART
jgi:hypothetical protein